jgi:hypothetical protein
MRRSVVWWVLTLATMLPAIVAMVLINLARLSSYAPRPTILVVGAFDNPHSFAYQARQGVELAQLKLNTGGTLDIRYLTTAGPPDSAGLTRALFIALATSHTSAIVSCLNSPESPPLLRIAQVLHIPVLLVVATNDALLGYAPNLALRIPPCDKEQAMAIAAAASKRTLTAVFHENNNYGNGLATAVGAALQHTGKPAFTYTTVPGIEDGETLRIVCEHKTDCIAYLGYYDRFADFLPKLRYYGYHGAVLLSDGCYSTELCGYDAAIPLHLAFPVRPQFEQDSKLSGFGTYGYQALALLQAVYSHPDYSRLGPGERMREGIVQFCRVAERDTSRALDTTAQCRFSDVGENMRAHFRLWTVKGLCK